MSERCYPIDEVVVACSGPSLRNVDVFSLGIPVVAISTAIRYVPNPNIWIYADRLNEMHGEEGKLANDNANILKFIPANKNNGSPEKNIVVCNYRASNRSNYFETDLFTNNSDFVRGPHKSITFAIQVLHYLGIKTLIFAGNDLTAKSPDEKYAYSMNSNDKKKSSNYLKSLNQAETTLKEWYPYAKKRGLQWYSWKCGQVFETFVPSFDETQFVKKDIDFNNYEYSCIQTSMNVNQVSPVQNIPRIKREIKRQNIIKKPAKDELDSKKQALINKVSESDKRREVLKQKIIQEKRKREEYKNRILSKYSVSKEEKKIEKSVPDRRVLRQMRLERSKRNMPWQK